jgi:RNA polymerase sigma-70 factor, ECF subfamily
MEPLEEDLLVRARTGDGEALTVLLERFGPEARRRITGRIPRRWRSVLSEDDVMQQTYVDAFRGIGRFAPQGAGSFLAWLTAVAKRNLLDALKMLEARKRDGGRRLGSALHDDSRVDLFELLGGTTSAPSRKAARQEAVSVMKRAIESLPDAYRQVVEMYDLEQCPVAEVSEALRRSPGAVYMLRARAHRLLTEFMGTASHYLSGSS